MFTGYTFKLFGWLYITTSQSWNIRKPKAAVLSSITTMLLYIVSEYKIVGLYFIINVWRNISWQLSLPGALVPDKKYAQENSHNACRASSFKKSRFNCQPFLEFCSLSISLAFYLTLRACISGFYFIHVCVTSNSSSPVKVHSTQCYLVSIH